MQLLSVNTARAIWLIQTRDLNPRGRNIDKLLEWLKSTYHFEKYPESPIPDENKGWVFSTGSFPRGKDEDGREKNIYVDLTIFNDGLVATTRSSTKDTEDFLVKALTLAAAEFHLVFSPEMIRKKIYLSELEVRMAKSLNLLNPKLKTFADRISSLQGNVPPISYECSTIVFQADPSVQQWRPSQFQLERKLNVPISENRYYSAAPLHTEEHLELLKSFEEFILVG
jgi:hypothetical protein